MRPRLGFLGVGWIGRSRLAAVAAADVADLVAVADTDPQAAAAGAADVGATAATPDELLRGEGGLDGIVIATPSALHADQAIRALDSGLAVFCQKPLGRTAAECSAVVDAARGSDLLLGVDLSYRHLAAVHALRAELASGRLGDIYATDLVFHNAYGPDKPWFTDPAQSGGGCVIDLGTHLVDLAMWLLDSPRVADVTARLFSQGRPLAVAGAVVEDFAVARLDLESGATVALACSWFLHAGVEAEISATFYGTSGAVAVRNVGGSFSDFQAVLQTGTARRVLIEPPDDWGGRALVAWAQQLGAGAGFDPACASTVEVARVLDRIYGR